MAKTYQQFLTGLSRSQLIILEAYKRDELARRGPEKSLDWSSVRLLELELVVAELQMRGEQLQLLPTEGSAHTR